MGDDLEERLKSHAKAFEGLMSLIPAKEYYGKDASITSEQWRKTKKQSKKEWQDAKRAKLDPSSHKTAKDVMDENAENARKRKRELDGEDSSDIELDVEKEKPLEGIKAAVSKQKKQKATDEPAQRDAEQDEDAIRSAKAEKRRLKREQKKEKKDQKLQKAEAKKARKEEALAALQDPPADEINDAGSAEEDEAHEDHLGDDEIEAMDISGLIKENPSTATPTSAESAGSTGSVISAASSSSSIFPPLKPDDTDKPKKAKSLKALSPQQHETFKERLQAKLAELRAARKADGPDGRPARNRQELIEARRKKQQERKEAQKANRQLAKEDEARMKAEAELARLRGSGSPYSMSGRFPKRTTPEMESNLAFGRVAWADGQQLDSNLSGFRESQKKGVSDPKTALEAAQKKKARINGLDEKKRKDIEEKDLWLAAKKRAQGERVHDDTNLLKKALNRKEKAKAKSKQEWRDRITNIEKGKEMKQKKREENLKKRKDEKKLKGVKGSKVKKPTKKTRRPGFEGTMKGR